MKNKNGLIKKILPPLGGLLRSCELCPRKCRVNRAKGEKGFCRAGRNPSVYSFSAHHGEEPPISGTRGSGTIFFSRCNMRCLYCQNYKFSQLSGEKEIPLKELADIMIDLEASGCHNINLVSPTHYAAQIVESISLAIEIGLRIPIVYNTGGYDSLDVIKLLKGIVDIYMPDMRYSDDRMALFYSDAGNYVKHNRACVSEMYKQAGDLVMNDEGIAAKGMIIRCLVLPNNISGTEKSLEFIAKHISKKAYISLMSQYYPAYRASRTKELSRRITTAEYNAAVNKLRELGIDNGWVQGEPLDFDGRFAGHRIKKFKIKNAK